MDLYETDSHSFVVRVWLEEAGGTGRNAVWRGHITHVTDGERRYVSELEGITAFIAFYLARMGVRLPRRHRVRLWLNR